MSGGIPGGGMADPGGSIEDPGGGIEELFLHCCCSIRGFFVGAAGPWLSRFGLVIFGSINCAKD